MITEKKKYTIELIESYFKKFSIESTDSNEIKLLKLNKCGSLLFNILDSYFDIFKSEKKIIFQFFEKLPEIYADIVSASENPNCSCRGRVIQFFSKNLEKIKDILFNILIFNEISAENLHTIENNLKYQLETIQENTVTTNYIGGKVVTITADENVYKNFIETLYKNNKEYKGLFILKEDDKWKIFFY